MKKRIVEGNDKSIHVLVAEDDSFQRLALMDILSLCNYEVTAVENGRLARDELLKKDAYFDAVLLDLYMPEMHGLELLSLMQQNESLKNIPVIMMSAEGERDIVSACLKKGAKDYLVKPLRITMVKGIANHVNESNQQAKCTADQKVQYKKLNVLGQGAAGSVELVQRTDNGQLYALKVIPLHFMSQQEKKQAESEVTLLKVLVAPTIIRYYDSFVESDSICIVMEYAKAGSLFDKIQEKRNRGEKFTDEQVLYYMAQLILGVNFMHSKNILHRDIKTQNMFLTSENIVKLGDFGIAKELGTNANMTKTLVGTPYFMSPEVCKGEPYGQKADVWAIGCTLYELIMLRRPFQHENINVLFEKIKTQPPDPVENCSQDIKVLIEILLDKDPSKRPSAQELAVLPCIFKFVKKYFEEEAPDDSYIEGMINTAQSQKQDIPSAPRNKEPQETTTQNNTNAQNSQQTFNTVTKDMSPKKSNNNYQQQTQQEDPDNRRIMSMAKALRQSVKLQGIQTGVMTYESNLVKGEHFTNWFKEHYPGSDKEIQVHIDDLIKKNHIQVIIKNSSFEETFYRFNQDIPGIPYNYIYNLGEQKPRDLQEIQQDLIEFGNSILKEIIDQYDHSKLLEDKILTSPKIEKFEETACELQLINLSEIPQADQVSFYLNLQQIMYLHKIIRTIINKKQDIDQNPQDHIGIIGKLLSFIPFVGPKVNYDIGKFQYQFKDGVKLTLEDIKHGILRGNKKPEFQTDFKPIAKNEKKYSLIQKDFDKKNLFLFKEENVFPKHLVYINSSNYEHELNKICKQILNSHVCYDSIDNDLTIHKLFQLYSSDFKKDPQEYIEFIFQFVKNLGSKNEMENGIKDGSIFIQFEENFE